MDQQGVLFVTGQPPASELGCAGVVVHSRAPFRRDALANCRHTGPWLASVQSHAHVAGRQIEAFSFGDLRQMQSVGRRRDDYRGAQVEDLV